MSERRMRDVERLEQRIIDLMDRVSEGQPVPAWSFLTFFALNRLITAYLRDHGYDYRAHRDEWVKVDGPEQDAWPPAWVSQ